MNLVCNPFSVGTKFIHGRTYLYLHIFKAKKETRTTGRTMISISSPNDSLTANEL